MIQTANLRNNAFLTLADSAVVSAMPGGLLGVLLTAAANTATVTLYDNATTNAGTVLTVLSTTANLSTAWMPPGGQVCANGIYALITGTIPSITVVYC